MSGSKEADPGQPEQVVDERSRDSGKGIKAVAKRKAAGKPGDVGRALRSVYDDTLREDIPSDLKDLLGRLG